ncbi:MAG: hypothetical protein ACX939_01665, partial [Hyphococcus sp.]
MLVANIPWRAGDSMSRLRDPDVPSVAAWLSQYLIFDQCFMPIFAISTFSDPLIGENRAISDVASPTILVEFRQDLTKRKFAWGFSYRAARERTFFFADKESFTRDGEQWRVFIGTMRIKGI